MYFNERYREDGSTISFFFEFWLPHPARSSLSKFFYTTYSFSFYMKLIWLYITLSCKLVAAFLDPNLSRIWNLPLSSSNLIYAIVFRDLTISGLDTTVLSSDCNWVKFHYTSKLTADFLKTRRRQIGLLYCIFCLF